MRRSKVRLAILCYLLVREDIGNPYVTTKSLTNAFQVETIENLWATRHLRALTRAGLTACVSTRDMEGKMDSCKKAYVLTDLGRAYVILSLADQGTIELSDENRARLTALDIRGNVLTWPKAKKTSIG